MLSENLLHLLQRPQYEHLLRSFRRVLLSKGSTLANADDEVAVLVTGQLRAYLSCAGQELILFNCEYGRPMFTNSGLLLRARQDCDLLVAPANSFLAAVMSSPELCWPLYGWIEHQFSQTLHILEGIRFLDVRSRLIRYIVALCEEHGQMMLDGVSIPFEDTIEDVANEIGSSRQTTSQVFNDLLKEGHIARISRTQLIVRAPNSLKHSVSQAMGDVPAYSANASSGGRSADRPLPRKSA